MRSEKDRLLVQVSVAIGIITTKGDVMDQIWERVGSQLLHRVSGPMKFRLVLQPAMAAFFAIRSGLADARAGKSPYFWGLLSNPSQRADMIKDGWKSVGRVFFPALVTTIRSKSIRAKSTSAGSRQSSEVRGMNFNTSASTTKMLLRPTT